MLENVLARRNVSFKIRITVKSLVSAGIVALAVLLPQLVHLAFGQAGGVQWLPMYLPVLLGGCLLGTWWGLGVGVAAPLVSFAITSAMGNAMPAASRLPFMVAELAVFAAVSGLFSKKIAANGCKAFPALLLAPLSGRTIFLLHVLHYQAVTRFSPALVWAQIQTGFIGLILQAVVVPFVVMGLKVLLDRDRHD